MKMTVRGVYNEIMPKFGLSHFAVSSQEKSIFSNRNIYYAKDRSQNESNKNIWKREDQEIL
jgi:hypothetical protein